MEFRESSESKQKSKRKRQRQERNPDERSSSSSSDVKQSSQHEEEEAQVLTPHTLRLLKLIQEGSTDHARFSVPQLKAITAGSSPIILWDILGRLLFFLNSPDWRTRHNASLAMEGVAQHLPIMDQQKFLQKESHHVGGEKHLWLTLADLKGKMKVILENGRNLMASSETNYDDQEDEELERLDSTMKGGKDFCEQRIQLQRAILARRLGLSGILGQYSEKNIQGAVTGDDLVPCAEKSSSRISTKRKYDKDEKPLTKDYVRALLVMEITQQEGSSGIISHENSQRLLAAELIYRMFDASWHVRHGSLMGILALMRAWQAHKSKASFGIWPHDILARSLCVLALDRFGDYSGASMESSGGVVSPVREMAGQVFSVIFQMSPDSVQEECFEILTYLLRDDEWEVRHGALTALKYTAALVIGAFSGRASDRQKNSLSKASTLAIARLEDSSDDVQSVAAHLLSLFFSGGTTDFQSGNEKIIVKIASPLWESLKKTRLVSSCIRDLVCLFSEIITGDCNAVLEAISGGNSNFGIFRQFFTRLNELLECDYISVKCSVVRAIGTIANQLATFCSSTDTEMDEGWSGMIDCFCCIIKSIYNLYFDYSTFSEGTDKDPILETFMKECRQTWRTLAKASGKILTRCNKKRSDLETFLILRYFDLSQRTGMEQKRVEKTSIVALTRASYARNLQLRLALADVLCNFLVEGSVICKETSHDMLELCICSSFESPFTSQCEAACFLFQALSNHFENVPVELNLLECVMQNCTGVLRIMVETSPFCIESSEVLASNPGLSSILFTSLTCGVDMVKNKKECGRTAARAVVNLWKEAISTQTVTAPNFQQVKKSPVTLDSLRLSVSVAGALISGGYRFLPEKLTPLVRALMTSIQSERDELCQITTCSYLSKLLHLLFGTVPVEKIDAYQRTYWKVLKNICNLIRSNVEPGCSAGSRVVGSMVINLSVNKDLKDLEPVWVSLSCLSSCDVNATERNQEALCMMRAVCKGLQRGVKVTRQVIECFLKSLVVLSCTAFESSVREYSSDHVKLLCTIDETFGLSTALPSVVNFLRDSNDSYRLRACILLRDMLDTTSMSICPFVRSLLPISMSLMTDPIDNCAKTAASIFSRLVQVAPLVRQSTSLPLARGEVDKKADLVMDHLIHGKPLPPCELHPTIINVLKSGGVVLRNYQLEGVSWLRFLQTVNLNGALCDSMGLGKTLQALLGVALSHLDDNPTGNPISLVICPSSVVGHWMKEIERFFPDRKVFQALSLAGSAVLRETRWKEIIKSGCNLVITNYAVLRSDVDRLSTIQWNYCVLDEGHLLKNPKTGKESDRFLCLTIVLVPLLIKKKYAVKNSYSTGFKKTAITAQVDSDWYACPKQSTRGLGDL